MQRQDSDSAAERIEEIAFGNTLTGEFHPAPQKSRAVVLAFHGGGGIGGDPSLVRPIASSIAEAAGVDVAVPGYRTLNSHGATIEDILSDAGTALAAMADRADGQQLYVLAVGFGAIPAVHAAAHHTGDVAGLILIDPVLRAGRGGIVNPLVASDRTDLSPITIAAESGLPSKAFCLLFRSGDPSADPAQNDAAFVDLFDAGGGQVLNFPDSSLGFHNRDTARARVVRSVVQRISGATLKANPPRGGSNPRASRRTGGRPRKLPRDVTILYGIGAQKAGTTWLWDYLARSSEVHVRPTKELHYFDTLHERTERIHLDERFGAVQELVAELTPDFSHENRRRLEKIVIQAERLSMYAAKRGDHAMYVDYLLSGRADERIVLDITPSYSTLDRTAFADMDAIGNAKYVFLMREPVARFWSQIRMAVRAKDPDLDDRSFEAACLDMVRDASRKGGIAGAKRADYVRTIRELEASVPTDRIHYAFHSTPIRRQTAHAICDFVGIGRLPLDGIEHSNVGRMSALPEEASALIADGLRPQYEYVVERFGPDVPAEWHERFASVTTSGGRTRPVGEKFGARLRRSALTRGNRLARQGSDILHRFTSPSGATKDPGPVVVFLNIPRTAGEIVQSELHRVMGADAVSPVRTHTDAEGTAQMPAGYRVHSGHIDWVDLETLPDNRFAFTILRDPRERIASLYFFLAEEAKKLTPEELDAPHRTGMRMIRNCTPEEYFFGGDPTWRRFIQDTYDNFYSTYFITRRMRGSHDVEGLSDHERLEAALEGALALDAVYRPEQSGRLERDLGLATGATFRLGDDLGPPPVPGVDPGSPWETLVSRFSDRTAEERLSRFVRIDQRFTERLEEMSRFG